MQYAHGFHFPWVEKQGAILVADISAAIGWTAKSHTLQFCRAAKMQYLFAIQVSRYFLLALPRRVCLTDNVFCQPIQKAPDAYLMLVYRRAAVCDVGPTLGKSFSHVHMEQFLHLIEILSHVLCVNIATKSN